MRFIIIVLALTFLITGVLIFGIPLLTKSDTHAQGGQISVSPAEIDAGDVNINSGPVQKTYEVKNTGTGPIKLNNIETSCACTYALFRVGDKTSPKFSMPGHGQNPAFWSQTLNPGETGELLVVFDPAFHGPDALGPIVRIVSLFTDDPKNNQVDVKMSANVVK